MKFIAEWFAGQCEICDERKSVREVAQGELFVCEQCQPSGSQWFMGQCEGCDKTASVTFREDEVGSEFLCTGCYGEPEYILSRIHFQSIPGSITNNLETAPEQSSVPPRAATPSRTSSERR